MEEEYGLLEDYARAVKDFLEKATHDYNDEKHSVEIVYATAPLAYAKLQEDFANGTNVGALITFYQSGIEQKKEETMGAWKIMPVQRDTGNYLYRAPIICTIKYTVTITAMTELQADMLQLQIMQSSPFHRPYWTKINGNFCLIEGSDYTNLSSVEVEANKDKIVQRQCILTIDRAYINYDLKELNAGRIKLAENKTDLEEREIVETLANGVKIDSDGNLVNGEIEINTSANSYAPFIYNVVDEDGNVVGVKPYGKVKVIMHSIG